jgi:CheY-like chemotaxis protein
VPGVAAVGGPGKHLGIFEVADLSRGGASLVGEGVLAPGELVELAIQLPGIPLLQLRGTVLRRQATGPRGRRCALRFERLTPPEEAALASALALPASDLGAAVVLVVWNRASGTAALARELGAAGTPALFAASPLEAAAWLRVPGGRLAAVMVDYLVAGSGGWDFLQYLRENHARMKRVLLVDGVGNFRLNLLLSSGLADAAIEKPWTAAALARKLGREPARIRVRKK